MSVELLQIIALISYILAFCMLITAIALFFVLKIPAVVGNLTGATARKAIESIRLQNENAVKAEKTKQSEMNAQRGRLTDKISPSGNLQHVTGIIEGAGETTKMDTVELMSNAVAANVASNETTLLGGRSGTETTILAEEQEIGATTLLQPNQEPGEVQFLEGQMGNGVPVEQESVEYSVDIDMGFAESTETID